MLVPTLPDLIDFGERNSEKDWEERSFEMHRLKFRFKEFCKHSLIPYEQYTQMGVETPNITNFTSTMLQMACFDLVHYAIIISGYGIVLEFINKKESDMKGPALFWLPFVYMATQALMVFVFYKWIKVNG